MNCAWCGEPMVTEAGAWVHASDRTRFRFEGNPPHIAGDKTQPLDGPEGPEETTMSKSKKTQPTTDVKAEAKPEKKATRKREPMEKVELRTLALRVTNDEFALVHKAAGERQLTAFLKNAVLNAANRAAIK